ncbi:MAG: hypothetical protein AAF735_08450 [Myxococcota bacterium]
MLLSNSNGLLEVDRNQNVFPVSPTYEKVSQVAIYIPDPNVQGHNIAHLEH